MPLTAHSPVPPSPSLPFLFSCEGGQQQEGWSVREEEAGPGHPVRAERAGFRPGGAPCACAVKEAEWRRRGEWRRGYGLSCAGFPPAAAVSEPFPHPETSRGGGSSLPSAVVRVFCEKPGSSLPSPRHLGLSGFSARLGVVWGKAGGIPLVYPRCGWKAGV